MFEEIVSFESFALFVFIVALVAGMAWRQMRWAAKPVEDSMELRTQDSAAQDFREAQAHYNDTEHEAASMEPFCGQGDNIIPLSSIKAALDGRSNNPFALTPDQERQARSRIAVQKAQEAARAATRHAQRMHVQKLENEYRAEQEQHNSSFRALGMTPVRIYPDQDLIVAFDVQAQKHVLVRDSWGERK